MSLSLDEFPGGKLVEELIRRGRLMSQGKCPYCSADLKSDGGKMVCSNPCRFGRDLETYYPAHVFKKFQYGDVT